MIAYNKDWLDALQIQSMAGYWREKGLITKEQLVAVHTQFPSGFYTPNLFVRIGLAIFTCILMGAAMGLVGLMVDPDSGVAFGIYCIFWGAVWLAVLEWMFISGGKHHRASGIDDMLLYGGLWSMVGGIFMLLPYNVSSVVYVGLTLPFLAISAMRYCDRLLTAAAYVCLFLWIFLVLKEIPGMPVFAFPFSGMALAVGVLAFSRRGQQKPAWRFWSESLIVLELLALLTFYICGNYWVVSEIGAELFQLETVPIAWFFWGITMVIPVVYIYRGMMKGDRLMMDTGVGCTVLAIATFRYYYHVLSWEWATAIAGAVLFLGAFFSIRYLRRHKGRFTYEADGDVTFLQEIEEQLIEQTIAAQPGETPEKKDAFGGGNFGGSGSGGEF